MSFYNITGMGNKGINLPLKCAKVLLKLDLYLVPGATWRLNIVIVIIFELQLFVAHSTRQIITGEYKTKMLERSKREKDHEQAQTK